MIDKEKVIKLLEEALEDYSSWDDFDNGYKEGLREAIDIIIRMKINDD